MTTKLSDYERQRLENIRKNQQVLQDLAIPTLPIATQIVDSKKNYINKPIKRSKQVPTHSTEPLRKSTRLQNLAMGVKEKLSIADEISLYRGRGAIEEKLKPIKPKRVLGNIPFNPENGATKEFSSLMEHVIKSGVATRLNSSSSFSGSREYRIDGEFSIAKVTPDRIYSMAVHPNTEKIIVAAGSKEGGFGIWDATDAWNGNAKDRRTFFFKPHSGSISNLRYDPGDSNRIFMSSYDGIVRCLDMVKGNFIEIYRSADDQEQYIAGFDIGKNGNILYFTDLAGVFTRYDMRSNKVDRFQLHDKKAGGLSISPVDNNLVATSSLDDTICIWDQRNLREYESDAISSFQYRRAVTSVFFHPQIKDALVSTCYDDHVRIHQDVQSSNPTEMKIAHNNQTGRWITPFRAIWDPKSTDLQHSHIFVGDMNRGLDSIEMSNGRLTNSISELLTSQPAVNAIHPNLDLIVSGNASGKCILWKCASS